MRGVAVMRISAFGMLALSGCLLVGSKLSAHHAVAGVYDLNKEVVLQGQLVEVNIRNPHSNLVLAVPNADGTSTEWVLTTASVQTLARSGINRTSLKAGDSLQITALPARNGNPAGFIRNLTLSDREISLEVE
jgi:hypothetical protein